MSALFRSLKKLYENDKTEELINNPVGMFWLKLRSISRAQYLRRLCNLIDLDFTDVPSNELFEYIFDQRPTDDVVEKFIRDLYEEERAIRRENENDLISQLYQMKVFDWGGLFQNSLEQTIVNNYVKKIRNWDALNQAIENELHFSLRGYVQCSWYNHWSSIIIEDIFRDHPAILPSIGLIKKVDFFLYDFPFDLKVTYFPDGFMKKLRAEAGLRPEFTELKAFCRQNNIWFDTTKPENVLFSELLTKVAEHPSQSAQEYLRIFQENRARFILQSIADPLPLKQWLYENQGVRRFDAANRFFLILVDLRNLEESWKLKRNKPLLLEAINNKLNEMNPDGIKKSKLTFKWENETYETYSEALFVIFQ